MNLTKLIENEVKKIITGDNSEVVSSAYNDNGKLKIVILNRGWVAVGKFSQNNDMCKLVDAKIIRVWGTTDGLGEIALNGPTPKTKLDNITPLSFHILTTVAILDCNEKKWN